MKCTGRIISDEELGDKITMEQYYYNHMNKAQQAAYHSILSGVKNLADEFQIPALEGEELSIFLIKRRFANIKRL